LCGWTPWTQFGGGPPPGCPASAPTNQTLGHALTPPALRLTSLVPLSFPLPPAPLSTPASCNHALKLLNKLEFSMPFKARPRLCFTSHVSVSRTTNAGPRNFYSRDSSSDASTIAAGRECFSKSVVLARVPLAKTDCVGLLFYSWSGFPSPSADEGPLQMYPGVKKKPKLALGHAILPLLGSSRFWVQGQD
jgi:hypothetical protein